MKKIIAISFTLYSILLIYFILFKFNFSLIQLENMISEFRSNGYQRVNLILLNSIKMQIMILDKWAILNLIGNTLPFIIYGFMFHLLFGFDILKSLLINFALVILIECIQLFFIIGTFDVDDILLNNISILVGLFCSKYCLNISIFSTLLKEK